MNKYQFLDNEFNKPLLIEFGQLGTCQLISRKYDKQLFVLKITMKQQAYKQILCLKRLKHQNIIQIVDFFSHQQTTALVFEFFQIGDLYTKIKCKQIKPQQVPKIFKDIVNAISFIHKNNIIHRNIKSQNIMLKSKTNAKIMDFGLAARLSTRKTVCGCLYYMAPQLLLKQPYSSKVDIWALGVILYQMSFLQLPFKGQSSQQLLNSIYTSLIYKINSEKGSLLYLIQMMLHIKPDRRPTPEQILKDTYLSNKKSQSKKIQSIQAFSHRSTQKYKKKTNYKTQNSSLLDQIANFFKFKIQAIRDLSKGQQKFNFALKKNQ